MTGIDPQELAGRYVAVWNEPDAARRRAAIEGLWADDGAQILQPPAEMKAAAAQLGFGSPTLQARGHDELEVRVTRSYQDFVAPGKFTFRSRHNADRLDNIVKFNWEMIPVGGGDPAGVGLEVLVLAGDGRIEADYQFIEPS